MAEKTTWIKIDRNILNWGWYKDTNTKALFIHLLIKANVKPGKFMGVKIDRGELATSYPTLAEETGLTVQNIRTAVNHLKLTGELTVRKHAKFSVFSIPNYSMYQDAPTGYLTGNQQATNRQLTGNQQQSKNKRKKEENNIYTRAREGNEETDANADDRSWEDELNVPQSFRGDFPDRESWLEFYRAQT